jgi:ABC-type sugar transport system substrate-binding protein
MKPRRPPHPRRWKCIAVVSLVATSTLVLAACSNTAGTSAQATPSTSSALGVANTADWNKGGQVNIPVPTADSGKGLTIGFSGFGTNNRYAQAIFNALQTEGTQYGATVKFLGPAAYDPQAQSQVICDVAAQKSYKLLVIEADDPVGITTCAKNAITAGIKVVSVGFPMGPDQANVTTLQVPGLLAQIAENQTAIGAFIANSLVASCQSVASCEVQVLWGPTGAPYTVTKQQVAAPILKANSNVKVVCENDASYTQDLGRSAAANCLQAHPNLHSIACDGGAPCRGAQLALSGVGKASGSGNEQVRIIETYCTDYGVQQVRSGGYYQDYFSRPASMGRAAAALILADATGQKIPTVIDQADLDGYPSVITPAVLTKYPELLGQFQDS